MPFLRAVLFLCQFQNVTRKEFLIGSNVNRNVDERNRNL